ncbi:MAG: putative metal-binding motif-containing protein [bacterium]
MSFRSSWPTRQDEGWCRRDSKTGVRREHDPDDYICSDDPSWEYTAIRAGDCNDDDAAISPGAVEVCDGIDNNCDGTVDEGFDLDADGYTTCAGDCDDKDDTVYPGAPGTHRGKDNDCNGIIDTNEKGRSIYPSYIPMLSSDLQYQQLWGLSLLPVYLDQQRHHWYEYQYTFYHQQLIKTIPIGNQSWFSITQPYWYYPCPHVPYRRPKNIFSHSPQSCAALKTDVHF